MELVSKSSMLSCNDEISDELYNTNVLVNVARTSCQNREFKGEYYGIPQNIIPKISNERNEYISLLTLISDKISHINKLNLQIESELSGLYKYSDNCR